VKIKCINCSNNVVWETLFFFWINQDHVTKTQKWKPEEKKKMVAALTRSIGMNDTNRSEEPQKLHEAKTKSSIEV
jgi:hypothetical protein